MASANRIRRGVEEGSRESVIKQIIPKKKREKKRKGQFNGCFRCPPNTLLFKQEEARVDKFWVMRAFKIYQAVRGIVIWGI